MSSCLLGEKVRYDGADQHHSFIASRLAKYAELVSICPEVGIGLGVPRPPIELVGRRDQPHALGVDNPALDVTRPLQAFARKIAWDNTDLAGYVFKSRSPSCGLQSTRVRSSNGRQTVNNSGLFSRVLLDSFPAMPVIEETGLDAAGQRDNFLERVFVYQRWLDFRSRRLTPAGLLQFHQCHELLLRTHGEAAFRRMQNLMRQLDDGPVSELASRYLDRLMKTLARESDQACRVAAFRRVLAALDNRLASPERASLAEAIDRFQDGTLLHRTLISHIQRLLLRYPDARLQQQVYLYPSRQEQALRF